MRLTINLLCAINDLYSLRGEDEFNLLHHIEQSHACTHQEAVAHVGELINTWTAKFQDERTRLPEFLDERSLPEDLRAGVLQYADGLEAAFRGNAEWTLLMRRAGLYAQATD